MSRANDIYENRIEKVLSAMDSIKLYALPKSEPWTLDRFLEEIKDACKDAAADLNRKSVMIEDAVEDLIGLALQALNLPDPEADENGIPSMGSSAVSPADRYLLEHHTVPNFHFLSKNSILKKKSKIIEMFKNIFQFWRKNSKM